MATATWKSCNSIPRRNGLAQITAALAERQEVDAIHIISHGTERGVKLGSTWLTPDSLDQYRAVFQGWGYALTEHADLLFYGCDLAASEEGRTLLEGIGALTGADVAASSNDTGHAELGGDWELEYARGDIEASVPVTAATQDSWHALLNTFVVTNTNRQQSCHPQRTEPSPRCIRPARCSQILHQ